MEVSAFHHTDPSTPEQAWRDHLAAESRPALLLDRLRRLVVVAAHPDDETLMAGGLVATAARAGIDVDVVVATWGEASHPRSPTHATEDLVALRRIEVAAAVRELAPAARLTCLGLPDGRLATHREDVTAAVVELVGIHGATTLIVAPWRGDGHCDHEAAALASASAAWRTDARLLEAPIWLWHWGTPGQPLPPGPSLTLSKVARRAKQHALAEHRSQVASLSDRPGDEAILSPEMLSHFTRAKEVFFDGQPGEDSPFEPLHAAQEDPWSVHRSFFEARKRALTLAALPAPRYGSVLELGCSVGALAADLAGRADTVLAVDESIAAVRRARGNVAGLPGVEVVQARVPEELAGMGAELVVVSEIGYFLSPGRLRRLVGEIVDSPCRTVVACHWRHDIRGWPLDGEAVHRIIGEELGMRARVHVDDPDFLLDVFVLREDA